MSEPRPPSGERPDDAAAPNTASSPSFGNSASEYPPDESPADVPYPPPPYPQPLYPPPSYQTAQPPYSAASQPPVPHPPYPAGPYQQAPYPAAPSPQAPYPQPQAMHWQQPVPAPRRTGASDDVRGDARTAVLFGVSLAVLGAVLGLLWSLWSPPGPRALAISPGVRQPDETEAFVAGDGRYLVISTVVGVLAALVAWRLTRHRGPAMVLALGLGCLAGSLLTELVGHLTGGGTFAGKPDTIIAQLPLSLHTPGFRFLEAGVAVLAYGMIVAFAVRDDLGRPDPIREQLVPTLSLGPAGAAGPADLAPAWHEPGR